MCRRVYPEYQPFDFPADLSVVAPSELTSTAIKGLSQARYARDLFEVFSKRASGTEELAGDRDLASIHQTWFKVNPILLG